MSVIDLALGLRCSPRLEAMEFFVRSTMLGASMPSGARNSMRPHIRNLETSRRQSSLHVAQGRQGGLSAVA